MYLMIQSHHRVESGTIHRRNQMSGVRIVRHNTTKTTTRADEFFDDFDIVKIILLLYVGMKW